MNEIEEREKADRKKKGGKDKKRKGEEETEQAKKKTKAWTEQDICWKIFIWVIPNLSI